MIQTRPVPLVHITTVPQTLGFLRGQIGFMKARGYEVAVISSPGVLLESFAARERIEAIRSRWRGGSPRCLTSCRRSNSGCRLRRSRPLIVHSHTPKAGLLGTLAARLAGVPVRIYHVHGLPLMTARSPSALFWGIEWASCRLASQVYCVSPSLRDVVLAERLCPPEKVRVILGGSINGVDALDRFNPGRESSDQGVRIRERYGIPPGAGPGLCGSDRPRQGIDGARLGVAALTRRARRAPPAGRGSFRGGRPRSGRGRGGAARE